jgi:hypothetical protein
MMFGGYQGFALQVTVEPAHLIGPPFPIACANWCSTGSQGRTFDDRTQA